MDEQAEELVDHSKDQEITPDPTVHPEIVASAVEKFPACHPGVEDGTVVDGEKIVHEKDDSGAVVGWHKEVVE